MTGDHMIYALDDIYTFVSSTNTMKIMADKPWQAMRLRSGLPLYSIAERVRRDIKIAHQTGYQLHALQVY